MNAKEISSKEAKLEGYLLEQQIMADTIFAKDAYVQWRGSGKCREMYPDFMEYRRRCIKSRWWLFVKTN